MTARKAEGDELAELARKIERDQALQGSADQGQSRAEEAARRWRRCRAEATVSRNYLDVLLGLPWGKKIQAQERHRRGAGGSSTRTITAREGQGPDRRISRGPGAHQQAEGPDPLPRRPARRRQDLARPSIARATGREFVRQSLGGVRDEAEIRGHRRTYIGSLPGKIVTNLKKAGHLQPAVPARRDRQARPGFPRRSRLGPARGARPRAEHASSRTIIWRSTIDLSDVMFVTTANTLNLPQPLLDRMEIIRLEGYTEDEKVEIAPAPPDRQADRGARPQGRRVRR